MRANQSLDSASGASLQRYLSVACLEPGTPVFRVVGSGQVDTGIVDPVPGNNSVFHEQNGPPCQFVKLPPGEESAAEFGPFAPVQRPEPYMPVAFPAGGGRP